MKRFTMLCGLFLLLAFTSTVFPAVPQLVNFQGILRQPGGQPVADATYSVTFKIYDHPTAPVNVLWTETRLVTTSSGLFTVLLGSTNPVPDSAFNDLSRYLGIAVSPDPEMTPRQQLVSVGYGFRISSVDGASGGTITSKVSIGPGHINTGTDAFVAGQSNTASGDLSSVGGGQLNSASNFYATVGGGDRDTASGNNATVGGGSLNIASGGSATVGGGGGNRAGGLFATVGGGAGNIASGIVATVGGGATNTASGFDATVSGGRNNLADDSASTVSGGRNNKARGRYSVVSGGGGATAADSNSALGDWSVVGGGQTNTASGDNSSVGGGLFNTASGFRATVSGGGSNTASGERSTVGGGGQNTASGINATVGGGFNNTASQNGATVGGGGANTASGINATVPGGAFNTAAGDFSFAAGLLANANQAGTFVWSDGNNSLDFSSTRAHQFLIHADSGVGIGTNSPASMLQVVGGDIFVGTVTAPLGGEANLWVQNSSGDAKNTFRLDGFGDNLFIAARSAPGALAGAGLVFRTGTAGANETDRMAITPAGDVGIGTTAPTQKLHVVGNICATGTIGACSDVRFKKSVQPLEGALDKIERLRGVSYRWNREKYPEFAEGKQIGFVAQEVRQVLPEVVSEGSDGTLSVDYGRLTAVLLEAMKEQQAQIEELRETIKDLKRERVIER